MFKNPEMLPRSDELTHASEKFDFAWIRSLLRNSEPGGGYHFVGCAAVANQLAAAWMRLAGAIPLSTVHSNSLLNFMLFCETLDLVWEIISVSEKRMKNSYCCLTIIEYWHWYRKKWRRWAISFNRGEGRLAKKKYKNTQIQFTSNLQMRSLRFLDIVRKYGTFGFLSKTWSRWIYFVQIYQFQHLTFWPNLDPAFARTC